MHLRYQQAIFHPCKLKCIRNYSSQQNWSLPHLLACSKDGRLIHPRSLPKEVTRCATTLPRLCWDNINHPLGQKQSAAEKKFSRVPNTLTRTQRPPTPLNCRHGVSKSPRGSLMWLMERVIHISDGLNWLLEPLLFLPTDLGDWYLKSK